MCTVWLGDDSALFRGKDGRLRCFSVWAVCFQRLNVMSRKDFRQGHPVYVIGEEQEASSVFIFLYKHPHCQNTCMHQNHWLLLTSTKMDRT